MMAVLVDGIEVSAWPDAMPDLDLRRRNFKPLARSHVD